MTLARAAGGVDRKDASRTLRRFDELGVFGWKAARRGSRGVSLLGLPHMGVPTPTTCTANGGSNPHEAGQPDATWGLQPPLHVHGVGSDVESLVLST